MSPTWALSKYKYIVWIALQHVKLEWWITVCGQRHLNFEGHRIIFGYLEFLLSLFGYYQVNSSKPWISRGVCVVLKDLGFIVKLSIVGYLFISRIV